MCSVSCQVRSKKIIQLPKVQIFKSHGVQCWYWHRCPEERCGIGAWTVPTRFTESESRNWPLLVFAVSHIPSFPQPSTKCQLQCARAWVWFKKPCLHLIATTAAYLYIFTEKVYLPNIVFQMVRSPNLQPNQVAFRVPQSCNKFDIHSYLTNIYGVNVLDVRTMNYATRYKQDGFRKWIKSSKAYKKAIVTIDEPFQWPEPSTHYDLDKQYRSVMQNKNYSKILGWRRHLTPEQKEHEKELRTAMENRAREEQGGQQ